MNRVAQRAVRNQNARLDGSGLKADLRAYGGHGFQA
jgi:hypothetical protein